METPTLIYCASGNKEMGQIAIDSGFLYGARLPHTIYHQPYFADQDWKNPNRQKYMEVLAQYRPNMVTVLDWERSDQLGCVLSWAEEASAYADIVVIIPKVQGGIPRLPATINGKNIRLGYSVPTEYGGTELPIWEFGERPVHLLGGSPQAQMVLARYLNVVSCDVNMHLRMATEKCQFWLPGNARYASNRWWPTLKESDGHRWDGNGPQEAFRRSCANIITAWRKL